MDPHPSAPAGAGVKADPARRLSAFLLDAAGAWLVALILSAVFSAFGARFIGYGLGLLLGAAYLAVRDGLALGVADGRSVGKRLLGLRPLRLDGEAMTLGASARRNGTLAASFALFGVAELAEGAAVYVVANPLALLGWLALALVVVEGVLVLTDKDGRRFGDKLANTQVVVTEA